MASRRVRLALAVVLTLGGLALLVHQVTDAGVDVLGALLWQIGWGFALILAVSFGRLVLRAVAWRALMQPRAPLRSTLAATISGDAIGNITPLNLLASEPAKAIYLGRQVSQAQAFAALAAENFFYSVSVAIYVIAGTAAMLVVFADRLPEDIVVVGIAALVAMALVLAGAGWLAWQRPSLLSGLLERLRVRRLAALVDRVRRFEVDAYGSAGGHAPRVAAVLICDLGFHLLSFAEAWLTLYLLTGASQPLAAFILDTANRIVNVAFRMVPLRAGVDEYASRAVSTAIGIDPGVGVAMALVRKARVLAWAAVGFLLLARRTSQNIS